MPQQHVVRLLTIGMLIFAGCAYGQPAVGAAAPTGLYETSFDKTTPLADIGEVLKRVLPANKYAELTAQNALPSGQVIEPAKEKWQVYVPESHGDAKPYGVLVWVEPMDALQFPSGWKGVLDAHHVIYVSAAESGNDQEINHRRIPLALTGLANIEARYSTDSKRIYIGGFSGGGKVASLIAVAYADVFTGGVFVANSFEIGGPDVPMPTPERYRLMQQRGRYVFLVGTEDSIGMLITNRAASSYTQLCILRTKTVEMFNKGHVNADHGYLSYALNYLDSSPGISAAHQADCEKTLSHSARR